jgi:hypothetical protein
LIYRVENSLGKGMYTGDNCEATREMHDTFRHPPPYQDARLRDAWDEKYYAGSQHLYNFGFSSLDQLRMWIYRDEWRRLLHDAGFFIHAYSADNYILGDTQAVFIRDSYPVGKFLLTGLNTPIADEWSARIEQEYKANAAYNLGTVFPSWSPSPSEPAASLRATTEAQHAPATASPQAA